MKKLILTASVELTDMDLFLLSYPFTKLYWKDGYQIPSIADKALIVESARLEDVK